MLRYRLVYYSWNDISVDEYQQIINGESHKKQWAESDTWINKVLDTSPEETDVFSKRVIVKFTDSRQIWSFCTINYNYYAIYASKSLSQWQMTLFRPTMWHVSRALWRKLSRFDTVISVAKLRFISWNRWLVNVEMCVTGYVWCPCLYSCAFIRDLRLIGYVSGWLLYGKIWYFYSLNFST